MFRRLIASRQGWLSLWLAAFGLGVVLVQPRSVAPPVLAPQAADRAVALKLHLAPGTAPGEPYLVPLRERAGWRMVAALGETAGIPPSAVPDARVLAGGMLVILVFLSVQRTGVLTAGRHALIGGLVLGVSPFWLLVGGDPPVLMSTLLAWAAMGLHVRRLQSTGGALSMAAALLIGLAGLNHPGWLFLWVVLCLHALLVRIRSREATVTFGAIGLQIAGGLVWVTLGLLPAAAWNLYALGIPWPPFPDAGTVLAAPGDLDGLLGTAGTAMQEAYLAYGRRLTGPLLLPLLLSVAGAGWGLRRGGDPDGRLLPLMAVLWVALLPAAEGLLGPLTGPGTAAILEPAVTLLLITAAASSLWALHWMGPFRSRSLRLRWLLGGITALLLAVSGWLISARLWAEASHRHQTAQRQVEQVRDVLAGAGARVVATDRWFIVPEDGVRLIDLTCELSPALYREAPFDALPPDERLRLLRGTGADTVVLWRDSYRTAGTGTPGLTRLDTVSRSRHIDLPWMATVDQP